jgi:anthranilate phosphoribosyltransferase
MRPAGYNPFWVLLLWFFEGDFNMQPSVKQAFAQILEHRDVPVDLMQAAMGEVMDGACTPVEITALLTGLRMKGESEEEIAGAAAAMRARAARIPTHRTGLLDTCGTGGDQLHTFNISTATAIVVASTGVPIAKHGNKGVSSSSGSADVLQQLGVNVELAPDQAGACLDEIGLCFCYARICHAAMKHVAPVRAELGIRTIFNFLGPLTNPAGAEYQLLGASNVETAEKLAHALLRLGLKRALVVCGNGELDEVALWGETTVFDVQQGQVTRASWKAADFGLPECRVSDLQVDSPSSSARIIREILEGELGPARNMVVANGAAALLCCGRENTLDSAARTIEQALDSGAALQMLDRLVQTTNRPV